MNKYYCSLCGKETQENKIACEECYEETIKEEQNEEWLNNEFEQISLLLEKKAEKIIIEIISNKTNEYEEIKKFIDLLEGEENDHRT